MQWYNDLRILRYADRVIGVTAQRRPALKSTREMVGNVGRTARERQRRNIALRWLDRHRYGRLPLERGTWVGVEHHCVYYDEYPKSDG